MPVWACGNGLGANDRPGLPASDLDAAVAEPMPPSRGPHTSTASSPNGWQRDGRRSDGAAQPNRDRLTVTNNVWLNSGVYGDVGDLTGYPGTCGTWSNNRRLDGTIVPKP